MDTMKASKTVNMAGSVRARLLVFVGGVTLFVGLGLALLQGGTAGVAVSFVGFTNQPVASGPKSPGFSQNSILLPQALLLAKNTGSVSVELYASVSQDMVSMRSGSLAVKDGFWPVNGVGLPRVLKPGESMLLEASPGESPSWSTEVQYQRRGFADRFWALLWNSQVAPLRAISERSGSSAFQLVRVKFGPLTNQPPPAQILGPPVELPPRWLEPPEVVKPGYSLDLIDTHH